MFTRKNRVVISASLTNAFFNAVWGASSVLVPLIAYSQGGSYFEISILSSVFALSNVLFPPFWGVLLDRTGKSKALFGGTMLGSVPTYLLMLYPSLVLLFWLRAAWGALVASVPVVTMAIIRRGADPDEIGQHMGVYSTFRSLGWAFGILFVGFLINQFSISGTVVIYSLLPVIGGVAFVALSPREIKMIVPHQGKEGLLTETFRVLSLRMKRLIFGGPLTRFCIYGMLTTIGYGAIFTLLPIYFVEYGISLELLSVILFLNTGAGILSAPFFGWAIDRYSRKTTIMLGALAYIVGSIVLIMSSTEFIVLAAAMLFTGLGNTMINTVGPVYATDIDKTDVGEILGVFWAALSLGWIIGPVFGGVVATIYSIKTSFVFALLIFVFAAFLGVWALKSRLDDA
ncbi:MAG: MFS transporter [Candidatus Ranarchaeia archaeon]